MTKPGYILVMISLCACLSAQKHDYYWIIGSREDMETGKPVGSDLKFNDEHSVQTIFVPRDYSVNNNVATICSADGELLFASNICNIYDKNHQPIPGGNQLFEHPIKSQFCETSVVKGYRGFQISFFLPHPAIENQYFFFHMATDTNDKEDFATHLFYSTLDANSNSLINKNQILLETKMTTGMMAAVRHADGVSWWILIPEQSSNAYFSILLDEHGLFHGPYKQTLGDINLPRVWTGSASFSPDGNWYARFDEANNLQLMRFNRCTGLFSNYTRFSVPFEGSGGASLAFSSNSQFLFCAEGFNLYQLNLTTPNISESNLNHIAHINPNPEGHISGSFFDKMQLAPDNKIYISNWASPWMHIIHDPNGAGIDCKLEQHAIKMRSYLMSTIPYMPNYRLGPVSCEQACCDTAESGASAFVVTPSPGHGIYRIKGTDSQMDRFSLFDMSGKLLLENRFVPCFETELDITHLPPGVYLLHVYGPDTFLAHKLMKI